MSMIAQVTSSVRKRSAKVDERDEKLDELISTNICILDYTDAEDVRHLFKPVDQIMYNVDNILTKMHECYLTVGIKNHLMELVGVVCIAGYPNAPSIPSDDWGTWLARIYGIKDVRSFNSFWIHLTLYDEAYAYTFLPILLKRIFEKHMEKKYILLIVPSVCFDQVSWMQDFSTLILPIKCTKANKMQTLRLFLRQNFTTNYKIRRAVEEDNDDLIPLIDMHSPRLKEMYGNYYIAEIITRHQDSGRHLIVAEYKGLAVALLCLNGNVNYKEIKQGFNLTVFNDLQKMDSKQLKKDTSCTEFQFSETSSLTATVRDLSPIGKFNSKLNDSNSSIPENPSLNDLEIRIEDDSKNFDRSFLTIGDMHDFSMLLEKFSLNSDLSGNSITNNSILDSESPFSITDEFIHETSNFNLEMVMEENAFVIEIVAGEKSHISSLNLLLEASFECFPNRDYCILSLPTYEPFEPILRYFTRIPLRKYCNHPHELYITHRSVFNDVTIKLANSDDETNVEKFCSWVKYSNHLFDKFKASLEENSTYKMLLFFTGNIKDYPIGVAVTNNLEDLSFLKLNYNLNKWINVKDEKNENFGVIEYFCISPIFKAHFKFIIREMHRKSGFMTLFYGINRVDSTSDRHRPFPTILSFLRHVKSKKMCSKEDNAEYQREPFALYISAPRLTGCVRYDVNTRIIVIGASTTSIAFLRALLYSSNKKFHFIFNNVTLVSPNGIGYNKQPNNIVGNISAKTSTMDFKYMEMLNLRCFINEISGILTGINRKNKMITINEKLEIPYDMLFIMCGLQYNIPRRLNQNKIAKQLLQKNMYIINTEREAVNALINVKTLIHTIGSTEKYRIIIYGCKIDAYCCISSLLEFGVKPEHIVFIQPLFIGKSGTENHDFVFQDGEVYETVINYISDLGIKIMTGYKFTDWSPGTHGILMQFESILRIVKIDALAVFLYPEKSVNLSVYKAIIPSGLVFDGRLVINHEYRTNDPYIYAAGPITKYSRKYYSAHLKHKYFDSEEIGEDLGKRVRQYLTPFDDVRKKYENDLYKMWSTATTNVVPFFRKPLITYCNLPGSLYYLNVCKPGVPVPLETAMCDDDYGLVLHTGRCESVSTQGYFRLHLNSFNLIETITCLSTIEFDWKKLILLWGKHEQLLNNLILRFETKFIDDLFQYFEESWCSAIFDDDFSRLENEIMRIMISDSSNEYPSPLYNLINLFKENGFQNLSTDEWLSIVQKFKDSPHENMAKEAVLNFIRDNLNTLNMYAHPVLCNVMLAGSQESPLFKDI